MNGIRTRKIVKIDEDKCDGCGVCVPSCAEGAIRVIDGKARLLAENLCDGLGNCLGTCPKDAIIIEERPAEEFDEDAVKRHSIAESAENAEGVERETCATALEAYAHGGPDAPGGCPGMRLRQLSPAQPAPGAQGPGGAGGPAPASRLGQWPVQLSLVPVTGSIWQDADVLIAADCVGFALPDFHERLLAGKTLVIACPKLDDVHPYIAKLAKIFADNPIRSITIAHMEVPCCNGIVRAAQAALAASGRTDIRMTDITVGIDGAIQRVS